MTDPEQPVEHFDLDEWLESVDGETIPLAEPDGLGWRPDGFVPRTHLCGNCEEMVALVGSPVPSDCPLCGRQIGILERGTQSVEEWREFDDGVKNV